MADVQAQQGPGQALAALAPNNGGGGGGGDGKDPNRGQQQPGRAHYATDDLIELWGQMFNNSKGSAGMKKKHRRCIRCGNEVAEHHRRNWRVQKCVCVLCNNTREHGHIGRPCPVMIENPWFFDRTWVRDAMSGYPGVRKGDLPPALTEREVRETRKAQFQAQKQQRAQQQLAPPPPAPQAV
ncbi:hypothetical protein BKA66DRAFT_445371, partial [Pyrenochaeta sp. MPI-SDFR-AT-0127]